MEKSRVNKMAKEKDKSNEKNTSEGEAKKEKPVLKDSEFIANQFIDLHYKIVDSEFISCGSEDEEAKNVKIQKGAKIPEQFVEKMLLRNRNFIQNIEQRNGKLYLTEEQKKKYNIDPDEKPPEKKPHSHSKYSLENLLKKWTYFKKKYGKEGDSKFKDWAEKEFGEDEIDKRKSPRSICEDIRKIVG